MNSRINKKIIAIVVAAVSVFMVLLIGASITVGIKVYNNTPEVRLTKGVKNFTTQLLERDEFTRLVQISDRGLVGLSVTVKPDGNKTKNEDNIVFGGNIYIENDAKEIMLESGYYFDGTSLKHGEIYISPDEGYVSGEMVDGGVYGYVRGSMQSAFLNSPFAVSGDYLRLSEENIDRFSRIFALYDSGYDEVLTEDLLDYSEKYTRFLYNEVMKNAVISESQGLILEEGVQSSNFYVTGARMARTMTLRLSKDGMITVLSNFYVELSSDEKLRDAAIEHIENMALITGETLEKDAAFIYNDFLDEIYDEIADLRTRNDIYALILSVSFDIDTDEVFKIELQSENISSNETIFSVYADGSSVKDSNNITLSVNGDSYKYCINENSAGQYSSYFQINGKTLFDITVSYSFDTFDFNLYDGDGGSILQLGGDWYSYGDVTRIAAKRSVLNGVDDCVWFDLNIDTSASMPRPERVRETFFHMSRINLEKYLFTEYTSEEILSGKYEYTVGSERLMTLEFDGLGVTLTQKNGTKYSKYRGSYMVKNGEIFFDFTSDTAYEHFEKDGNTLLSHQQTIYITVNGYTFYKAD